MTEHRIEVKPDGSLSLSPETEKLLSLTKEQRVVVERLFSEGLEAVDRERERRHSEHEALLENMPPWQAEVQRVRDRAVELGQDPTWAERNYAMSSMFNPWRLPKDAPTVPEPLKRRIVNLPQEALYSENLTKFFYQRPFSMRGYATKEHHKVLAEAAGKTDKVSKALREEDPILRQYQIIHDEALANTLYWRYWFGKAAEVLEWRTAVMEGKKARPPKWFVEAIKDDQKARDDWRTGQMPKGVPEKEGMFATEPMTPKEERDFQMRWYKYDFTSPAGTTGIHNPPAWWKGLGREGREDEWKAALAIKDDAEREGICNYFRNLDERFPLPALDEGEDLPS